MSLQPEPEKNLKEMMEILMAKKYYAVRAGRTTGIFTTWDDCRAQVIGFKGAEYKSFPTMQEAQDFLNRTALEKPKPAGISSSISWFSHSHW